METKLQGELSAAPVPEIMDPPTPHMHIFFIRKIFIFSLLVLLTAHLRLLSE
jgi:hypothetical protein